MGMPAWRRSCIIRGKPSVSVFAIDTTKIVERVQHDVKLVDEACTNCTVMPMKELCWVQRASAA
jgi:hypothetical protein